MARKGPGAVLGLVVLAALAMGAKPPPAVTVRLIHPEVQGQRLLALFQGARAPHPAAALSAWKRAMAPHGGGKLDRSLEAAIAAFNPELVGELRVLDRAELFLAFDPVDGRLRWHAHLPRDDGAIAALATALALTDGGSDPPLDGLAVDRLGPPGWPLAARADDGLVLAGSRTALRDATGPDRPRAVPPGPATVESGWLARVDPEGLGRSGSVAVRRAAEALRALGCRTVDALASLEGETLGLTVMLHRDAPPGPAPTIDLAWLDGLPKTGVLAAFAWAVDPGAEAVDRAFALADRVERADPARAGVAPLRTRINLLAATAQVRPEVDLWPHLRGLSGAVLVDAAGQVDGAIVVLHIDGPESAGRIAGEFLPRLAPLLGLRPDPAAPPLGDCGRRLGRLHDRPLFLDQRGATVRLGWGEGTNPGRSIGPSLRALAPWGEAPPRRFGAFWPGRLALATAVGEPLARTLAEAPPILWSGRDEASGTRDVVCWSGLRGLVHRFLDRLPLDPPPGR